MSNRIDKITGARTAQKDPVYTDFYPNFNKHPETGKLVKLLDGEAIKRGLRNLIYTNQGERFFDRKKGCNIRKVLFENFSDQSTQLLKKYIEDAINNYEPRVSLLEVSVTPFEEQNFYSIVIIFEMINHKEPLNLTLKLYRVR